MTTIVLRDVKIVALSDVRSLLFVPSPNPNTSLSGQRNGANAISHA